MKHLNLFLSDPLAKDFDNGIDKFTEKLNQLLKRGVIKDVRLSYDDPYEDAIKSAFKQIDLPIFEDGEIKQ